MSDERTNPNQAKTPGSYRDLIVWQKAMTLAKLIYGLTQNSPPWSKNLAALFDALRRELETLRA